MLTLGHMIEAIEHRLGGPVAPELGGGLRVANDAGRLFYSMHAWRHALTVSVPITVAAGDTSLVVPANFKGLVGVRKTGNAFRMVSDVGAREMLAYRMVNIMPFALDLTSVEPDQSQPSGWRIGIYPAIQASEAGAYTFDYWATWTDKASPGEQVFCAQFAEPALIHLAREYATGLDVGDMDARLASYENGLLFMTAKRADGASQDTLGRMNGGAAQAQMTADPYSWMNNAAMSVP